MSPFMYSDLSLNIDEMIVRFNVGIGVDNMEASPFFLAIFNVHNHKCNW